MELSRARGVALILMVAVATSLASVAPAVAQRGAPTASVRQTAVDTVRVSGRTATRSPKVRLDRRTPSGWTRVTTVRAHRHHYAATLRVAPGATVRFRVTSDHRSRSFLVALAAATTTTTTPTSSPPATPAPAPTDSTPTDPTTPCGQQPVKADGSPWTCTFDDEFDGTSLDRTKWIPNTAFVNWSDSVVHACFRDNPANVNVADGVLSLTLLRLDAPAPCALAVPPTDLMSGSVSTYHLFSQQYGRFEARIKTTASTSPGLHDVFWLWPDNRYATIDWPASGEIDVAESFSAYSTITGSYLHYTSPTSSLTLSTNAMNCTASRGVWNTYTVEWGPSRIETFVNGRSCLVNTSGDPAFQKRYIINLTQGMGGGPFNQLGDGTPIPASMQVDYVRVWQ